MNIQYYYIEFTGCIYRGSIETSDASYISHTDVDVTFKKTYTNIYCEIHEEKVTCSRLFETIRQERIDVYKKQIELFKDDLETFEKASDYEYYWKILKEKNKKNLLNNLDP